MQNTTIFSAFPYFYSVSGKRTNTVRYIIRMFEDIDGEALRKAVDTAFRRYPYLKVRYRSNWKKGWLEPNDADIIIAASSKPVTLADAESNQHLVAFGYESNNIFMYSFHGLFDGRGRAPFLRTLIYYYCTYRYGEDVSMDDVNLVDTPIDSSEYEDPLNRKIHRTLKINSKPLLRVMRLRHMGKVSSTTPTVHCIKLPEEAFIKWCKKHDATPNTAVALLMARAIASVHPDFSKKICAGICCDLRPALNSPKTHRSLVWWAHLLFNHELSQKDLITQCTALRGQLALQSDADSLKGMSLTLQKMARGVFILPTMLKKVFSRIGMAYIYNQMTFGVSYSGKLYFGSCSKHIKGLYAEPDTLGCGIMTEICVADGYILLDMMQEWSEDDYFKAFLAQLESIGIEYVDAYSGPSANPPIALETH